MAEKEEIEVDEERMMRMMAADVPLFTAQTGEDKKNPEAKKGNEIKPEMAKDEEIASETASDEEINEPVKPVKRKNVRQFDFEGAFLKEAKITDRRQMYISGVFYDKISAYLRIISEGKVSMVGYVHNVLAHHMLEFKDAINEMYQNKIEKNKSNPL